MALRSHSRGSLARVRDKIEHSRILKNNAGRALLGALVRDGVLKLEGNFYHYQPERASLTLGITWQELRRGGSSKMLGAYLAGFVAGNAALFPSS